MSVFVAITQTPVPTADAPVRSRSGMPKRLEITNLRSAIAAFGVKKVEQRSSAALIRVFTDITLFFDIEVAGSIELNETSLDCTPS